MRMRKTGQNSTSNLIFVSWDGLGLKSLPVSILFCYAFLSEPNLASRKHPIELPEGSLPYQKGGKARGVPSREILP